MRLLRKLLLALCAVYLAMLGVAEYLTVRRELQQLEHDVEVDLRNLSRLLRSATLHRWQDDGEEAALRALAQEAADASGPTIRWVPQGEAPAAGADRIRLTVPLVVDGVERGAIELSESRESLRAYARRRITRVALLGLGLFGTSLILIWGLGRALVGARLGRLVEQARRIGAGELEARADVRGADEIALLGRQMNIMADQLLASRIAVESAEAERLQALAQMRHADRLASIGRISSVLAHELGTPLNIVLARAKLIADRPEDVSEVVKNAEIVHGQARRMTDAIRATLGMARQASRATRVDLCEVAREGLRLLEPLARTREIKLSLRAADGPAWLEGRPGEIGQVVNNLVSNALDAVERGGHIELEVTEVAPPPERHRSGPFHCLSVRDDGCGIPPADLARVFQPYFTSKAEAQGTGLGLWIVEGIVREHGGWIEMESEVGRGTCVRVYLPAAEPAP